MNILVVHLPRVGDAFQLRASVSHLLSAGGWHRAEGEHHHHGATGEYWRLCGQVHSTIFNKSPLMRFLLQNDQFALSITIWQPQPQNKHCTV